MRRPRWLPPSGPGWKPRSDRASPTSNGPSPLWQTYPQESSMAARTGPACGADRRNGKGPCRMPAGNNTSHEGTGHCSWHGGASPSGTRAANEKALNVQAARELARLDVEPVTNAFEQLALVAGQPAPARPGAREKRGRKPPAPPGGAPPGGGAGPQALRDTPPRPRGGPRGE